MVLEAIEQFFASIGMGDPAIRFIGTAAAAAGLFWLVKPKLMFGPDGQPRPFGAPDSQASNPIVGGKVVLPPDQRDPTYITWWVGSIAVGGIFALFL